MAKGVVNRFQRVLGVAVQFRLAHAQIGDVALDRLDRAGIAGRLLRLGDRRKTVLLAFEMAQNVLQPLFDPVHAAIGAAALRGGFQPLQQIADALFEMGEGRRAVIANRQIVEPLRQRLQGAFELRRGFGLRRAFAVLERQRQRRDALFQRSERDAVIGAGDLIDLRGQRLHIVAEPGQRFGGGNIGNDGAQRRDRGFELLQSARIVAAAHDHIDLAAEIADRLVEAGQLFRGRQRAQHFADFGERAFDTGQRLGIDTALPAVIDALRQRAHFAFQLVDGVARHRLGNRLPDFGQLRAEPGDRLLDMVRALQRVDLVGDAAQLLFEIGKASLRHFRHRLRRRLGRRNAWRGRPHARQPGIEFALPGRDFGDRIIERAGADRR